MATASTAAGIPQCMVPYHINVGGVSYTTSLETLTRCPGNRLAKMFSGLLPVTYDPSKQQYAIDRDGNMFRHILNFLRNNKLDLPEDFNEHQLLLTEATYFEITALCETLNNVIENLNTVNIEMAAENKTQEPKELGLKNPAVHAVVIIVGYIHMNKVIKTFTSGEVNFSLSGSLTLVSKQLLDNGFTLKTSSIFDKRPLYHPYQQSFQSQPPIYQLGYVSNEELQSVVIIFTK